MSKLNAKLSVHEKEIGIRLKMFRGAIRFSQAEFARLIGITRDQLASIEYGRTPIRYRVAWMIRERFRLSIDWLLGGDMRPDDLSEDKALPHPDSPQVSKNALLTEVFKEVHKTEYYPRFYKLVKGVKLDPDNIAHRCLYALWLKMEVDHWLAEVPDSYTVDFSDKVRATAKKYLEMVPKDSVELVNARDDEMLWERMRAEASKSLGWAKVEKTDLTKRQSLSDIGDVKSLWTALKRRLQSATETPGKRSELAKFLGVQLSLVSRWLSEKKSKKSTREPGAEYTLKMLQWVEAQERLK